MDTSRPFDAGTLPGIVLAAGASSRMGVPKALLADRSGHTFATRIVQTLRAAGLVHVTLVTGVHHDAIVDAFAATPALAPRIIRNPDPARGQLSSLWVAMDEVCSPSTGAILVTLVDVPLVTVQTVHAVIEAWARTRAPIVRPMTNGRRGHPVVFDRAVFAELRAAPVDAGARVVVRNHFHDALDVPVDDPGCLIDIDTPADYAERIERAHS